MITILINILIVAMLLAYQMKLFATVSNLIKIPKPRPTSRTTRDGTYTNRKGTRVGTVKDGQWKWTSKIPKIPEVGSNEWLQPQIQEQIRGFESLFKYEVIRAIHEGRTPPHLVGVGTHTRQSLLQDWNDEWEAIASKMGIKLFEKRKTVGTPGPRVWVDARPEKTLYLRVGSNPLPLFAKPKPPPNPPPPTSCQVIR